MAIRTIRKRQVVENLENPHWEALTEETQRALQLTARLPFIHSYYLAGGVFVVIYQIYLHIPQRIIWFRQKIPSTEPTFLLLYTSKALRLIR